MHEVFLNICCFSKFSSIYLFIWSNIECTWIIIGRVDRLQALHDKPRNNHKNRSWRGIPSRELSFIKMLRRYQWWCLLLLNLNGISTRSNWLCWKAGEKLESRFCKTIGCSYLTLLTTYLSKKKAMFKVSNKNIRKRCLLISKITLKTSNDVTCLLAICRR